MSFNAPGPSASPSSRPQPHPQPHPYTQPQPPQFIDVLRSPQGLATALTALLCVCAALALAASGIGLYAWKLRGDLVADPRDSVRESLEVADSSLVPIGAWQLLTGLATAVVFLVWFYRVRCNGQVFRPDGFSQSTGWAVGGWFVPLANLFFPYRTAREIWDASTQHAPDGSYRPTSGALVIAWWLTFVGGRTLDFLSSRKSLAAETAEAVRDADLFAAMADLTTFGAAVLAVLFVRKLTAMQRVKAARGPIAAV
ncbi:DUF4328 domain-containing protein [Streptomyces sp. NPDC006544]|uniref:DUF4328 domain-containing protein n=1 Tax=Streptomyces sp. NPDC006544 TaxID=3154583 RepID=UPI00339EDAF0